MRSILAAALLGVATFAQPAAADDPVVVELFTSQGCSSCPPADALLEELAERPDVIALALHVDYWDYIGWADSFASPAFTARQHDYAKAAGERTVYTPQFVVGGTDYVIGARPMELMDRIRAHEMAPEPVDLSVELADDRLSIRAETEAPAPMDVFLVRYRPKAVVEIPRGENAGRTLGYANIVTSWQLVAEWDGSAPLDLTLPAEDARPLAVLVQRDGPGLILAAAKVD